MFENLDLQGVIISYVALIFSLSVHEASHATMAYALDDDTAARLGRMTLNPLPHLDPIGTVLFPLINLSTGFPMIGWAKPVPVNGANFTRKVTLRGGHGLVAFAGPASNMVLAALAILALALSIRFSIPETYLRNRIFETAILGGPRRLSLLGLDSTSVALMGIGGRMVIMNFGLAIFNLLPIGPLDGGWVLKAFLPYRAAQWMDHHAGTMYIALIILVFAGALGFILGPLYEVYILFLRWIAPFLLGL